MVYIWPADGWLGDIRSSDNEKKLQILDLTITIIVFIIACIIGKLVMTKCDTWIAFNGPALGILAVGELVWWRVRKLIVKKWEDSDGKA